MGPPPRGRGSRGPAASRRSGRTAAFGRPPPAIPRAAGALWHSNQSSRTLTSRALRCSSEGKLKCRVGGLLCVAATMHTNPLSTSTRSTALHRLSVLRSPGSSSSTRLTVRTFDHKNPLLCAVLNDSVLTHKRLFQRPDGFPR